MNALINPRSRLHAVEPIGRGTSEVESLLSYLCRLAVSHSISTIDLSRLVVSHLEQELHPTFKWHQRRVSGMGETALTWSATLSAMTSIPNLDGLTFQPWRHVVAQNGIPVHTQGQFCPDCLQEDRDAGRVPYLRLSWEAADVMVCHRHKRALLSQCHHCGESNVRHAAAFVVPGWCTKCGHFLGEHPSSNDPIQIQSLWQAKQVAGLLASPPGKDAEPLREGLIAAITHIISAMDGGKSAAFAKRMRVSKSTLFHSLKDGGTPTLALSLKIAFHAGIPLTKLLSGDVDGWHPPVAVAQMSLDSGPDSTSRAAARTIDWLDIEEQLKEFLKSPTPISVHEAARRLELDERQLYLRVNQTTRLLSERWLTYLERRRDEARVEAKELIAQACREIAALGQKVDREAVEARVPPEALSKVPRLHSVINGFSRLTGPQGF